ncbi:MAG: UvrD-helicase domain-containing protein [Oscillospiraceae bacterium]
MDADRLLVVTFSNAAASEMKERIVAQLAELPSSSRKICGSRGRSSRWSRLTSAQSTPSVWISSGKRPTRWIWRRISALRMTTS